MKNLAPQWQDYARIQREADRSRTNSRYWAVDDAADVVLDWIKASPETSASNDATIRNLFSNRAQKYRRRAQILHHQLVPVAAGVTVPSVSEQVEAMAELDRLRGIVSEADWDLLVAIAEGESYADLADCLGDSVGALKMRVSRLRKQLH